jgi:ATP-binding cassette subfamily F protein uup
MSLLSAHGVEKSYGVHRVLAGVSASIAAGDRVGLVGNNGSGKSTLARIIGKLEQPDVGTVMQQRGTRIGYLPQVPQLDESLTVMQAALAGLADWQAACKEHESISRALAGGEGAAPLAESERRRLIERQSALGAEIERMGGWDQEHRASAILQRLHMPDPNARIATASGGAWPSRPCSSPSPTC